MVTWRSSCGNGSSAVAWQESDDVARNIPASDTPGHPAESQTQTMFVMFHRTLQRHTTPPHQRFPPRISRTMCPGQSASLCAPSGGRVSHGTSFLAHGSLAQRRLARVIHHHHVRSPHRTAKPSRGCLPLAHPRALPAVVFSDRRSPSAMCEFLFGCWGCAGLGIEATSHL